MRVFCNIDDVMLLLRAVAKKLTQQQEWPRYNKYFGGIAEREDDGENDPDHPAPA